MRRDDADPGAPGEPVRPLKDALDTAASLMREHGLDGWMAFQLVSELDSKV